MVDFAINNTISNFFFTKPKLSCDYFEEAGLGFLLKDPECPFVLEIKNHPDFSDPKKRDALLQKYLGYLKKWQALDLNLDWIKQDPVGARCLLDTRLIYSILGFQNSSTEKEYTKGCVFLGDKIWILKEGKWVSVQDEIAPYFTWSRGGGGKIIKKGDKPETPSWSYLPKGGLQPIDRWKHPEFPPVTKLSTEEHSQVLRNTQSPNGSMDFCVLQVVTQPKNVVNNTSFFKKNAIFNATHAYVRIIDHAGNVYSSGLGFPEEEKVYLEWLNRFATTINSVPTILDYQEFQPHEGKITTNVAITNEQCNAMIERIKTYREQSVRYNVLKQNCCNLAVDLLSMVDIKLDIEMTITEMFAEKLSDLKKLLPIKILATPIKFFNWTFSFTPDFVKKAYEISQIALFFFPKLALNFLINMILYYLGSNIGTPLKESGESETKPQNGLKEFQNLGYAILSSEMQKICHSTKLIQWQLDQENTWVHSYRKRPSMSIVPPTKQEDIQSDLCLKKAFQDAYQL